MSSSDRPGDERGRYPGWDDVQPGPSGSTPYGWGAPPPYSPPSGQSQPEPQQPVYQQPASVTPYGHQLPPGRGRGPWVWLLPLLLIVLVAAGLAGAWLLGLFGTRPAGTGASSPVTVTATEIAPATPDAAVGAPAPEPPAGEGPPPQRPTHPGLPAGAMPANDAARNGLPAGDFNNVYRGTDITSEPFARAVRDDYVGSYLSNGNLDQVIYTLSPVTGQRYEMTCTDNGSYVTCRGGNNAVVYIS